MTFFEDIVWFRKKEKVTGVGSGEYRTEEPLECSLRSKFCDGEGSETWGLVMM